MDGCSSSACSANASADRLHQIADFRSATQPGSPSLSRRLGKAKVDAEEARQPLQRLAETTAAHGSDERHDVTAFTGRKSYQRFPPRIERDVVAVAVAPPCTPALAAQFAATKGAPNVSDAEC